MRTLTKFLAWIAVAIVIGALYSNFTGAKRDDDGSIIESGSLDVFKIQVGDCMTEEGLTADLVEEAKAVPCEQPHFYEAYHSEKLGYSELPSDIDVIADEICYVNFESYVGLPIEETYLSYTSLFPTQGSWDGGDREVTCLLHSDDDSLLTGSARF